MMYRDENGITDDKVGELRDILAQIEIDYPGVRLVAVDEVEDELLFGGEYVDEQEEKHQLRFMPNGKNVIRKEVVLNL